MTIQKRRLTIEDFLAEYSVSRSTFYRDVKNKTLRTIKDGGRVYIIREDAEAWLEKMREENVP